MILLFECYLNSDGTLDKNHAANNQQKQCDEYFSNKFLTHKLDSEVSIKKFNPLTPEDFHVFE